MLKNRINRLGAFFCMLIMLFSSMPVMAEEDGISENTIDGECEEYIPSDDTCDTVTDIPGTTVTTLKLKFGQTEARQMLDRINAFRKSDQAWYWNKDDSEKYYPQGLKDMTYDYTLEKIAMIRAAEIAVSFSHTRPNGKSCFSLWDEMNYSWNGVAENIAYGYGTEEAVFIGWREDNDKYSGQGHRRNMLSSTNVYVGIGHAIVDGRHYWVQDFCANPSGLAKTEAADCDFTATVNTDGTTTLQKDGSSDNPSDDPTDTPTPTPTPKPVNDPKYDNLVKEDLGDIVLVTREKYNMAATIKEKYSDLVIYKYKSSQKSAATVSSKGVITGKSKNKEGYDTAEITAYYYDSQGNSKEAAVIKLKVYKPVFKFTDTDLTYSGQSISANSFLKNVPDGKKLVWSVPASKSEVMSIDASTGMICAGTKKGTVKVSVTIGEGTDAKYKAELKFKIPKLKSEVKVNAGKTKKLTLKNISSYNRDRIKWTASGSNVSIEATKKGNIIKLTGISAGTCTVTATLDGKEYSTEVIVE